MRLNLKDIKNYKENLKVGDKVLLSGTVYTARDMAHKRIMKSINKGEELPFPIEDSFIYYCGPTPAPAGRVIGSAGPTTSSRMEPYIPKLLSLGLGGIIGKGPLSDEIKEDFFKFQAIYFCAVGGAGALYSKHITECVEIAYFDLGPESVKRLTLSDFPVYVGIDFFGNSLF